MLQTRRAGQVTSGSTTVVPKTPITLGATRCLKLMGKYNCMAKTQPGGQQQPRPMGKEHRGHEPEQRSSAHLCLGVTAC